MRTFFAGSLLCLAAGAASAQEGPAFDLELLEEIEGEVRDAHESWMRDRSSRRFSSQGNDREVARGYVRAFWDRYPEAYQEAYPKREWAEWLIEEGRSTGLGGHFDEILVEVVESEILRVSAHRGSVTVVALEEGEHFSKLYREEWIRDGGEWRLSRRLPPVGQPQSFEHIRAPVVGEELLPGSEDYPTAAIYFADLQESLSELERRGVEQGQTTAQHQRELEEIRELFDGYAISDVGYILDVRLEHGQYVTVVDCGHAHLYVSCREDMSEAVGRRAAVWGRTVLWRAPQHAQRSETPNIFTEGDTQVHGLSWRVSVSGWLEVMGRE